jgi:hypothetical protein
MEFRPGNMEEISVEDVAARLELACRTYGVTPPVTS